MNGQMLIFNNAPITVDKGWAWMLVFLLFIFNFLTCGGALSLSVVLSHLLINYGEDHLDKFAIQAAVLSISNFGGFVGIFLLKHFGNRVTLCFAGGLTGLGYIIASLVITTNAYILYLSTGLLIGIGAGISLTSGYYFVAKHFCIYVSFATSLVAVGPCVGGFVWPIIFHTLIELYGLYGGLLISGAIIFHTLPFSLLFVYLPNQNYNIKEKQNNANSPNFNKNKCRTLTKERTPLKDNKAEYLFESNEKQLLLAMNKKKYNNFIDFILKLESTTLKRLLPNQLLIFVKNINLSSLKNILQSCLYFKKPISIMYALSFILIGCSVSVLYSMIAARGVDLRISKDVISIFVINLEISDTVGRILTGLFSDLPCLRKHRLAIYGVSSGLLALIIYIHIQDPSEVTLHILSVAVGLFGGVSLVLYPVLIVDEFGFNEFEDVYVYISLTRTPFTLLFGLLCQNLREVIGSWFWPFVLCDVASIGSGAVLFIKCFSRTENRSMKVALQLRASLENVTNLHAVGDDFRWFLKLKCLNCGEISDTFKYLTLDESQPLKGGRGSASLVLKCHMCARENSIDILRGSLQSYNIESAGRYETLVVFDCRGVEPVDFSPRSGFAVKGSESNTEFDDVNLCEGDWVDYDDKAKTSVRVCDIDYKFVKIK